MIKIYILRYDTTAAALFFLFMELLTFLFPMEGFALNYVIMDIKAGNEPIDVNLFLKAK